MNITTIKQLKEFLETQNENKVVLLSIDEEGNSYHSLDLDGTGVAKEKVSHDSDNRIFDGIIFYPYEDGEWEILETEKESEVK